MNNKIKAMVLDVDGVIIGEKIGFNTPLPSIEVSKTLRELHRHGYIVSFCTSKPFAGVEKTVRDSMLLNCHITDGGAVLFDASVDKVIDTFPVDLHYTKELISEYIQLGYYVAIYTPTDYIIQKSKKSDISDKHEYVLQKAPIVVDDLLAEVSKLNIIKIVVIAKDESDKIKPDEIFRAKYSDKFNIKWGQPPIIKPLQFGIITNKEISKGKMLLTMMQHYKLQRDDILSIGNSNSDWDFMRETEYVATLENGQDGIKGLVSHAGDKSFISRSVDENGFIDIVKHFELL